MEDYRGHLVITVAEAAEWLRTSEEAILKLAEEDKIPAVRYTPDDPPVFRPEDIVAFVERQSGSENPSGLFGAGFRFAPIPVRGVPVPPVPPVAPRPPRPGAPSAPKAPRAAVFSVGSTPGQRGFEQAFEYSFSTESAAHDAFEADRDVLEAQREAMEAQREALAAQREALVAEHEALATEVERLHEEVRRLHEREER